MQMRFKSRQAYLEWRSHWRRDYAGVAGSIRQNKAAARKPTNNAEDTRHYQSALMHEQMVARTMLMAREAAVMLHDPVRFAEREAKRHANEVQGRLRASLRKQENAAKYAKA